MLESEYSDYTLREFELTSETNVSGTCSLQTVFVSFLFKFPQIVVGMMCYFQLLIQAQAYLEKENASSPNNS